MAIVSANDMKSIIGPELGLTGPVAGLGIHYEVVGDTKISSATPAVEVKLNEASLKKAEHTTGVSRSPAPGAKASATLAKGENAYASMFDKKNLQPAVERGLASKARFGSYPNYRMEMSPNSASKNPLARVKQRRMLELRKTFDQIAAQKKKAIPVNPDKLPQVSIVNMVEEALSKGETTTPIGSLEKTMKMAGYSSKEIKKAYKRWEHALIPGSYESEPMGPTRIS